MNNNDATAEINNVAFDNNNIAINNIAGTVTLKNSVVNEGNDSKQNIIYNSGTFIIDTSSALSELVNSGYLKTNNQNTLGTLTNNDNIDLLGTDTITTLNNNESGIIKTYYSTDIATLNNSGTFYSGGTTQIEEIINDSELNLLGTNDNIELLTNNSEGVVETNHVTNIEDIYNEGQITFVGENYITGTLENDGIIYTADTGSKTMPIPANTDISYVYDNENKNVFSNIINYSGTINFEGSNDTINSLTNSGIINAKNNTEFYTINNTNAGVINLYETNYFKGVVSGEGSVVIDDILVI